MRILAVAGASGGHIFPALGLLEAARASGKVTDTLLVLPKKINIAAESLATCKVRYIHASNIKLSVDFRNFIAILEYVKAFFEGVFIILEFRPRVVVGFGSLVSIPLVMPAWLFRIKTIVHEQNVVPGRANRFLSLFVDKIALSFEETRSYLKASPSRMALTGNPLRKDLRIVKKEAALEFFGLGPDKKTILVMGGSKGSVRINNEFVKAVGMLEGKKEIQVIHLSGEDEKEQLKKEYSRLGIEARVFGFFDQMHYAYSASDFVVCRAGATTIAELRFFRLPAIIIPYPFAYEHQLANAEFLRKSACAAIAKEEELAGGGLLSRNISSFLNPVTLEKMRSAYANIPVLKTDALLLGLICG